MGEDCPESNVVSDSTFSIEEYDECFIDSENFMKDLPVDEEEEKDKEEDIEEYIHDQLPSVEEVKSSQPFGRVDFQKPSDQTLTSKLCSYCSCCRYHRFHYGSYHNGIEAKRNKYIKSKNILHSSIPDSFTNSLDGNVNSLKGMNKLEALYLEYNHSTGE